MRFGNRRPFYGGEDVKIIFLSLEVSLVIIVEPVDLLDLTSRHFPSPHHPSPQFIIHNSPTPFSLFPSPQLPLCNNYWQPEIRSFRITLCAFCQKNFFFAIKLHKKKIIVVGEID